MSIGQLDLRKLSRVVRFARQRTNAWPRTCVCWVLVRPNVSGNMQWICGARFRRDAGLASFAAELERSRNDVEAMRRQAENTNNEYDRLMREHANLQEKVHILETNAPAAKKDE